MLACIRPVASQSSRPQKFHEVGVDAIHSIVPTSFGPAWLNIM